MTERWVVEQYERQGATLMKNGILTKIQGISFADIKANGLDLATLEYIIKKIEEVRA